MNSNNNIILNIHNTQILVSRYNNKQLTVYSNRVELKENYNSYGMIIPFPNKNNNEPIILNTSIKDEKIFKNIDDCFTNNKTNYFKKIINYIKEIELIKTNKILKNIKKEYLEYLPITYYNDFKYSIANNVEELKKINPNELNFILNLENRKNFENQEFGFIVLWINNSKQPPPLAFLTNIENNKFFIPTKFFNLSNINSFYQKENCQNNINNKLWNFFNFNIKYKVDNNFKNKLLNYSDREIVCLNNLIQIDYKLYILHTTPDNNNSVLDFNSINCTCTFNKYLKSCSSKNMLKFETNNFRYNKNLYFNVDNNNVNNFIY
jgi:hypothetical protein